MKFNPKFFSTGPGTYDASSFIKGLDNNPFSLKSPTSSSMFDPVTLGLGLGSLGLSFLGQRNSNRIAQQQIDAAAQQNFLNRQANREAARIQQQENAADRSAMYGWGADLDFQRQIDAEKLNTGIFGERRQNLANREKIFNQALLNSPDAKEYMQFQNRLKIEQTLAEKMGAMQGMFGQIRPINISTMFS